MPFLLQPWHILLAALCGMVNERQQQVIEFQNAQIETLLKKLGKKRLLLNDDQRRLGSRYWPKIFAGTHNHRHLPFPNALRNDSRATRFRKS